MIITNDKHNDIPYFYRSFLPNIDSMAIWPTNPNLLRVSGSTNCSLTQIEHAIFCHGRLNKNSAVPTTIVK